MTITDVTSIRANFLLHGTLSSIPLRIKCLIYSGDNSYSITGVLLEHLKLSWLCKALPNVLFREFFGLCL